MKTFILLTYTVLFTIILLGSTCEKSSCPNCNIEPDAGSCKASFSRYYFDKEEGICKEFQWGGCDGSVPFETLKDCIACQCQN